jgi:hypothetical protein
VDPCRRKRKNIVLLRTGGIHSSEKKSKKVGPNWPGR